MSSSTTPQVSHAALRCCMCGYSLGDSPDAPREPLHPVRGAVVCPECGFEVPADSIVIPGGSSESEAYPSAPVGHLRRSLSRGCVLSLVIVFMTAVLANLLVNGTPIGPWLGFPVGCCFLVLLVVAAWAMLEWTFKLAAPYRESSHLQPQALIVGPHMLWLGRRGPAWREHAEPERLHVLYARIWAVRHERDLAERRSVLHFSVIHRPPQDPKRRISMDDELSCGLYFLAPRASDHPDADLPLMQRLLGAVAASAGVSIPSHACAPIRGWSGPRGADSRVGQGMWHALFHRWKRRGRRRPADAPGPTSARPVTWWAQDGSLMMLASAESPVRQHGAWAQLATARLLEQADTHVHIERRGADTRISLSIEDTPMAAMHTRASLELAARQVRALFAATGARQPTMHLSRR